jgi:Zn-dependent M28 family amino/carboxypeptidase
VGVKNGDIYNGADDDGSGLRCRNCPKHSKGKDGHGPKRSILFFITGEEHGLLGSSYYSENPLFPWRIPLPILISI